jgi:hypothetical protein
VALFPSGISNGNSFNVFHALGQIPLVFIILMLMAIVLQWAYKLVCCRNLRYSKACKIMLVLFLLNVAMNFLVSGMTVSMSQTMKAYVDFTMLPVAFLVGVTVYARWMNDKRGRPIGFSKALMVQGLFYAISIGISLICAIPIVLLLA